MDEKEILRGYRTAMSAMILRAKGGKGFIFTAKANRLAKEMKPLLKQADKYVHAEESMLAFGLFSLIMEKLIMLYIDQIQKFMQWAVGRRYYQGAAGYVKRIRKLGGEEAAIILVDTLCNRYPARTAMIEELRRALG